MWHYVALCGIMWLCECFTCAFIPSCPRWPRSICLHGARSIQAHQPLQWLHFERYQLSFTRNHSTVIDSCGRCFDFGAQFSGHSPHTQRARRLHISAHLCTLHLHVAHQMLFSKTLELQGCFLCIARPCQTLPHLASHVRWVRLQICLTAQHPKMGVKSKAVKMSKMSK